MDWTNIPCSAIARGRWVVLEDAFHETGDNGVAPYVDIVSGKNNS